MSKSVTIDGKNLTFEDVIHVSYEGASVTLAPAAVEAMKASRAVVDRLAASDAPIYGVNTGFGMLADHRIPPEKLTQLQYNLLRSHAAGVGDPLPEPVVRATMLLRANVMATGGTGVRPLLAQALVDLLNKRVTPVIPSRGSVGASGDLAPLSHLALVLIGEGEATFKGTRYPGLQALTLANLKPVDLKPKEGLSLVNGTQIMAASGVICLAEFDRLCHAADVAGAMTVETLLGTPRAFDPRILAARPHPGAIRVAENLLNLLANSEIAASHRESEHKVQDPYSLRCMPQVHGASRDAGEHVREVFTRELNACTDNPIVDAAAGELLSGGNFHGQPLALALDYLGCAGATLGVISERRTEQMVNPKMSGGLPPFLANDPGVESGFMIPHVTAAALVSENKILCHPASVDSIPTSAGQEDHVSMGVTAALTARKVLKNVSHVLAIELLVGTRGIDLRLPLRPGTGVAAAHSWVGARFPHDGGDRVWSPAIEDLARTIRHGNFKKELEITGVKLR